LAEEDEDLIVVLAGGALAEPGTADGIGGVDACVYRQARGCDGALGFEFARRGLGELSRLGGRRRVLAPLRRVGCGVA